MEELGGREGKARQSFLEGVEAQTEFLGTAVRERHFVSFQRFCMCTWPLDSGAMPTVPTRF